MLRKIFFCLLVAFAMSGLVRTEARNDTVSREWGRILGTAHTDRDFLIYDATCSQGEHPAIYIVGKAEAGSGFELKQGENT